jgi:hypothetical protein
MILTFVLVLICQFYSTGSTRVSDTPQNTSTVEGIIDTCYSFLESHLCQGEKWNMSYHFYRPSIEKYSADQWLWDSGSHMIVWSNKNVTNSVLDLRTMLKMQLSNGRIPEEIFWSERTPLETAAILLEYSNANYTDITQMPVLPYSLRAIYEKSGRNKQILSEFLNPLVNYFTWWRSERDLGDGLVVAIHNWETGLDASPAYDPAFHVYVTEVNETSRNELYPKFIELCESYRFIYHWNTTEILSRETAPKLPKRIDNWFLVKDLALNSVYASGWDILGDLASEFGDDELAGRCHAEAKRTSDAILTKMWIDEQGRFNSLYIDADGIEKASIANTVQNLFPLLLRDLPADKVDFIADQLADENKFFTPFTIPTVARDDPQFCPTFDADLMWRGPIWGFTNWFLLEGLELHGQFDLQVLHI